MKTYETIIITTPELPEDEEKALVDSMVSILQERDGELHINDRMGRRRLAYPIRKLEEGVYTRLLYDSGSDVPTEMERRLRLSDRVLRVLTVALEKEWAKDAKEAAAQLIVDRAEAAKRAVIEAEEAAKKAEEDARKAEEEAAAVESQNSGAEAAAGDAAEAPDGEHPANAEPVNEPAATGEAGEAGEEGKGTPEAGPEPEAVTADEEKNHV